MSALQDKLSKGLPKAALLFTAGTEATGVKTEGEKGIKVHLKARSRDAIEHWCFGSVAHDFSTLSMPAKIALDDTHGNEIGHGRPTLTAWGLEIDGVVIPNATDPRHDANRVAYNLENGIPQQASIDFTGDYDVLEIPAGLSYPVNGKILEGPACVIQNWSLRACAICKAGADPNTSTEALFAEGEKAQAPRSVTTLSAEDFIFAPRNKDSQNQNKEQRMANEQTQAEEAKDGVKPNEAEAQADKKTEAKPEAQADEGEATEKKAEPQAQTAEIEQLKAQVSALETKLAAAKIGTKPIGSESGSVQTREQLWAEYGKLDPKRKALFYAAHRDAMKSN